jgi:hypothetical protein
MFMKRYRMNQLTIDPTARRMSMLLQARQQQISGAVWRTHRVVKFMVKVKLMENRVNSHVGRVMVAKVMTQKRRPGIMRKTNSTDRQIQTNIVETL